MSKRKFRSPSEIRLAKQEPAPQKLSNREPLLGWRWRCDAQACFTACSPEVEAALGISPQAFIGEHLADFSLFPSSSRLLRSALESSSFPTEIAVDYQARDGRKVPVILAIFRIPENGDAVQGWQGAAEVIQPSRSSEKPAGSLQAPSRYIAHGAKTFDANPKNEANQRLIKHARKVIVELLEEVRQKAPPIQKARITRIVYNERHELKEDRSQTPSEVRSFSGKTLAVYPKKLALEVEYRLEWGKKSDFSRDEKEFLQRNKYKPSRLQQFFHRASAPKGILRRDMQWFTLTLSIDEDGQGAVWLGHPTARPGAERVALEKFLHNPSTLQSELIQAIRHPWRSRLVYRLGRDYWIQK